MKATLSFGGETVAILGGADRFGGLCGAYLADRGANVVTSRSETAGPPDVADDVNLGRLTPSSLVQATIQSFGGLDALILLLPEPRIGSDGASLDVVDVGGAIALRANLANEAIAHFRSAGRGRLVLATSGSALFADAADSLTAALHAAMLGLLHSLTPNTNDAVRVNAVSPITTVAPYDAALRDRKTVDLAAYDPRYVLPAIAYLAHRSCAMHGTVLSVGGGRFARVASVMSTGLFDPESSGQFTAKQIRKVTDCRYPYEPRSAADEALFIDV